MAFALAALLALVLWPAGHAANQVAPVSVQASTFRFCSPALPQCSPTDAGYVLTVPAGTPVTWVYNDAACDAVLPCPGHNVVFEGEPDTPLIKGNAVDPLYPNRATLRERTFDAAGTYQYWCTPHKGSGMTGSVVVT